MARGNEFTEIMSAIFAIIIFATIGGAIIQSLGQQTDIFGLSILIPLIMIISFLAVIIKLVEVVKELA